jgi:hypothetical protein
MPTSRQIVIHHDDVAANLGTIRAFEELFDLGVCSSGSIMVPCPWFPEAARLARERPDLDLGVHLVLNAEFAPYRWRPLTGVSSNGLTDTDGYFWRDVQSARNADPEAVETELRAQIDAALSAGIDVTHLDSHMGTVMMPEFVEIYARLGADSRLPIFFSRDLAMIGAVRDQRSLYEPVFATLAARGNPDFAAFLTSPWGELAPGNDAYRHIFSAAQPGLNWGAMHFDKPGGIEDYSTDAPMRIAEYDYFRSGAARALFDELNLELVGMRRFRDEMRG